MRKINTDNLPRHASGNNSGNIDWCNTVGLLIQFEYDGITGEIEILNYYQTQNKVTIRYNNSVSTINTYALIKKVHIGSLIGACGHHSGHRVEVGAKIIDDKRNMEITGQYRLDNADKKKNRKVYSFICHNCGWKNGEIIESELFQGKGCSCCGGSTVVLGINDISTTAPWMTPFFKGGLDEAQQYTKQSNRRVVFVCPNCGKEKDQTICSLFRTRSIGCMCGDGISFPEKFMISILNQTNTDFTYQYHPDWSENRYYDFYVQDMKMIIEMDGGLGHGHKPRGCIGMSPEKSVSIDEWKDCQAQKHGLSVVRIDAQKSECNYLRENILSALSHLLILDLVDWDLATEYATKNLVKDVCTRFDSSNLTIKEIATEFNLSTSTIVNYLKQGKRLSWCSYDPVVSRKRAGRLRAGNNKIAVSVFKGDILIKKYDSVAACIDQDEAELNVKISNSGIYRALKDGTTYKGYNFKYTS